MPWLAKKAEKLQTVGSVRESGWRWKVEQKVRYLLWPDLYTAADDVARPLLKYP